MSIDQGIEALLNRFPGKLHELPRFRHRVHVFEDRRHAGRVLAEMLADHRAADAVVLAVPAGGVPVAVALAGGLGLALDVAVVSKVTLPWNTEVGCGAVAFDGTSEMNEALLRNAGLSGPDLADQIEQTRRKVQRRQESFRADMPELAIQGRDVFVVDDGLASGFTMLVAARVLRRFRPTSISIATPTAPASTARRLLEEVDELWCANLRSGVRFAVADAYRHWRDIPEEEAVECFRGAVGKFPSPGRDPS